MKPPTATLEGRNIHLTKGDSNILHTRGGGGYGDPAEREPEPVLEDVEMGYVTQEAPRRDYRVAVEEHSEGCYRLDEEGTRGLRG